MIDIALDKTLQGDAGRMHLCVQTTLQASEFVALFGPSGAGKTTVLRMLAGLVEPNAGRIVVDGNTWFDSTKKVNLAPQLRSVGFVFQDYALFPNLTVRQNVGYALGRSDAAWLDELIDLIGLGALQNEMPATLSGGQKQRAALARAVARKPKLLLLDEPLSALDIDMRVQLQDELGSLHRRFGFTIVLVSHDMGEVFKLSQRVLRLDQGKIIQSGTPAEVFLSRRLAGRLQLQAQVLAVRREEVIYILSLLIGNEIVDVIASADEVDGLATGDLVSVSAKAFSPLIFKRTLPIDGGE